MIVYISGAITSDKHYRRKFAKAEKRLRKRGFEVINPAKIGDSLPELTYQQYLHIDEDLIEICEAIYFLKDWESSNGARYEFQYVDWVNTEREKYKRKGYMRLGDLCSSEPIKLIFEGENEDEL